MLASSAISSCICCCRIVPNHGLAKFLQLLGATYAFMALKFVQLGDNSLNVNMLWPSHFVDVRGEESVEELSNTSREYI